MIFQNSNTTVAIYTTASNRESERARTTYGMIISDGEKSYKDVLGKVKAIMGTNQSAKAIRSLRSTKDGKLLLTIEKDQEALRNIHGAISDSATGLKSRRLGMDKNTAIHIRGMEAETTVDNIKSSVVDIVGIWEEENKLSELRPLSNDTLAATLTLKSNTAEKILQNGFLQVGLVKCRVEKRLNVQKCQKCWSYEHYTDRCIGPDSNCFKCSMSDHNSKACINEEACVLCNEKGHKIGTMRCPKFKEALKHARKEESRKAYAKTYAQKEEPKQNDRKKETGPGPSDETLMEDDQNEEFSRLVEEVQATWNATGRASSPTQA